MKRFLATIFCFCVFFSSLGFAESKSQTVGLSQRLSTAQNEFPDIFRPIGNFFKRIFRRKSEIIYEPTANVTDLVLSQTEVAIVCSNNNSCSGNKKIEVSTTAVDPENNPMTYNYNVSDGKILGEGAIVIWDLSGVKPGINTITAGIEDGCGVCGLTITKQLKVVECPNCN